MRFGVVVHGAEVIDSGFAVRVLDLLGRQGEVVATLGGAMGMAAILDADLQDRISIVPRQLVSNALLRLDKVCDATLMVNWSKSLESGLGFGGIVARKLAGKLSSSLVQLDRDFFVEWVPSLPPAISEVIEDLGLERVEAPVWEAVEEGVRILHGVRPGENIWINGTVVGRATSSDVAISLRDGRLEFRNVAVKPHGLERVKLADVRTAVIRSGAVRRTTSTVRAVPPASGDRVILVDHQAEDSIFRADRAWAAVTVGDDTTRIATSLLARLGVPVIGIVDGDEDGLCADDAAAPGSATVRLQPGNDDQLGVVVRDRIFGGDDELLYIGSVDELVDRIATMAGSALIEVKKSRRP